MVEHFGKEIHTPRYFWLKTKATYPIVALCGLGCLLAFGNSGKNFFYNFNVTIDRRNLSKWNKQEPLNVASMVPNKKVAETPLAEADKSQL